MIKKTIYIFLILIYIASLSLSFAAEETIVIQDVLDSQKESLNINAFLSEAKKYSGELLEDTSIGDLLNAAIKGNVDNSTLFKKAIGLLGKETRGALTLMGSILVIIVIHSILKTVSENLENESAAKITYYVQYVLIVTLIMTNFSDIIRMTTDSIQNMVGFMHTLVPLLMGLMIATGSIASSGMIQPIIIFLITFIGNILETIILPLVLTATVLGIISKISDKVQIDKLSKFFKTSVVWGLGVILTLFVGVVSLEGTLSSTVDGITAKTTKAAVSSFIPVVGKILGDAVDTVIGCAAVLKNAVGIVGVLIIIGICAMPIIKLAILTVTYHLTAAVCQPIADDKIVSLLGQMGDTFKVLLAILCSISVMLMIGVTLVVKISNSGLMYR